MAFPNATMLADKYSLNHSMSAIQDNVLPDGNNPAPVKEFGKCCDACNRKFVIPARLGFDIED